MVAINSVPSNNLTDITQQLDPTKMSKEEFIQRGRALAMGSTVSQPPPVDNSLAGITQQLDPTKMSKEEFIRQGRALATQVTTQPEPVPTTPENDGGFITDTAKGLAGGAAQLVDSFAWLADTRISPLHYINEGIDKATGVDILGGIQEKASDVANYFEADKSQALQEAKQRVAAAEGGWDTFTTAISSPRFIADLIATSVPSLLPVAAASRIAYAARGASAAAKAALVSEALVEGASGGTQEQRRAMATMLTTPPEQLAEMSKTFADAVASGMSDKEAIEYTARNSGETAAVIGAAISLVAGKLTGAAKLESKFFTGGGLGKTIREKAAVYPREVTQELLQEGGNQFGGNVGAKTFYNPETGLMEAVPEAAALGAVGAFGQTGAMQLGSFAIPKVKPKASGGTPPPEQDPATPVEQPVEQPVGQESAPPPVTDPVEPYDTSAGIDAIKADLAKAVIDGDVNTANKIFAAVAANPEFTQEDISSLDEVVSFSEPTPQPTDAPIVDTPTEQPVDAPIEQPIEQPVVEQPKPTLYEALPKDIQDISTAAANAEVAGMSLIKPKRGKPRLAPVAERAIHADIVHTGLAQLVDKLAVLGLPVTEDSALTKLAALIANPLNKPTPPRISLDKVAAGSRSFFGKSKVLNKDNLTNFFEQATALRKQALQEMNDAAVGRGANLQGVQPEVTAADTKIATPDVLTAPVEKPQSIQAGLPTELAKANKLVSNVANRVRDFTRVITGKKTPGLEEIVKAVPELEGHSLAKVNKVLNDVMLGKVSDDPLFTAVAGRYVSEFKKKGSIAVRAAKIGKAVTAKAKASGKATRGAGVLIDYAKELQNNPAIKGLNDYISKTGDTKLKDLVAEFITNKKVGPTKLKKALKDSKVPNGKAIVTALAELKQKALNSKSVVSDKKAKKVSAKEEAKAKEQSEADAGLTVNYRDTVDKETIDGYVPPPKGAAVGVEQSSLFNDNEAGDVFEIPTTGITNDEQKAMMDKWLKENGLEELPEDTTTETVNEEQSQEEYLREQDYGYDPFENDDLDYSIDDSRSIFTTSTINAENRQYLAKTLRVILKGAKTNNKVVGVQPLLEVIKKRMSPNDPLQPVLDMLLDSEIVKSMNTLVEGGSGDANGTRYSGYFDIKNNKIVLSMPTLARVAGGSDVGAGLVKDHAVGTLIHEVYHAVTTAALTYDSKFANKIESLMEIAATELEKTNPDALSLYGFTNAKEFLAEVIQNPKFQQVLGGIKYKDSNTSVWSAIKNAIFTMLSDVFGTDINKYRGSILAEVLTTAAEVNTTPTQYKDLARLHRTSRGNDIQLALVANSILATSYMGSHGNVSDFNVDITPAQLKNKVDKLLGMYPQGTVNKVFSHITPNNKTVPFAEQRRVAKDVIELLFTDHVSNVNPTPQAEGIDFAPISQKLRNARSENNSRHVDPTLGEAVAAVNSNFRPVPEEKTTKNSYKKKVQSAKKLLMGWMTLDAIETEWRNLFAGVYDSAEEVVKKYGRGFNPMSAYIKELFKEQAAARKLEREADPINTEFADFENNEEHIKSGAVRTLRDFIEDATLAGVNPDSAWDSVENEVARNNQTAKTNEKVHARLAAVWETLPPEAQAVYKKVRDFYAKVHEQQRTLVVRNLLELNGVGNVPGLLRTILNAKTLEELQAIPTPLVIRGGKVTKLPSWGKIVEGTFAPLAKVQSQNGPYFPIKRFGNYVVEYNKGRTITGFSTKKAAQDAARDLRAEGNVRTGNYVQDGNGWKFDVNETGFSMYESLSEAEDVVSQLKADGFSVSGPLEKAQWADGTGTDIGMILRNASAKLGKGGEESTQAQVALREALISLMPESSIQKSLLKRKGVLGAGTSAHGMDSRRIFAAYAQTAGWNLASLEHRNTISDYFKLMMDAPKIASRNGKENALRMSQVANELSKRRSQGSLQVGKMGEITAKTGFLYFLLSLSYSMVNATQPALMTIPFLSGKFGSKRAASALAGAYKDIGGGVVNSILNTWGGAKGLVSSETVDLNTLVETIIGNLKKAGKHQQAKLIRDLADMGKIDVTFALEISEAAKGAADSKLGRGINKVIEAGRVLPFTVELMNRATTAIAAFDLHMSKKGATYDSALEYASDAIIKTQFDYSTLARPRHFVGSDVARAFTMFKIHPLSVYTFLIHAVRNAYGKNPTAEERIEAKRQLRSFFFVHAAATGAMGTVLLEPIKVALMMVSAAFGDIGDEDEDWLNHPEVAMKRLALDAAGLVTDDEDVQDLIARVLSRGVGEFAGVNMVPRIGLQNMLLQVSKGDTAVETVLGTATQTIIGPILGQKDSINRAFANLANGGDLSKSAEYVLPKFARDTLKAFRIQKDGITDWNGNVLVAPSDITWDQTVAKVVGFGTSTEADLYLRRNYANSITRSLGKARHRMIRRIVEGKYGSPASAQARKARKQFNDSLPADLRRKYKITADTIHRAKATRRSNSSNTTDGVRLDKESRKFKNRLDF